MKKIGIILGVLLFTNGIMFAEPLKEYVSEFFNKGNYILRNNVTDCDFFPKHIIARIICENDQINIIYVDREYDYETISFNTKKYSIQLDENSNIIISKK